MTREAKAFIAGAFEHPDRVIPDKSIAQIHAEVAVGALQDAGLEFSDVDFYGCAADAQGAPWSMVEYLGLKLKYLDTTDIGGSSPLFQLEHAVAAIETGRCHVALITLGGKPRAAGQKIAGLRRPPEAEGPEAAFESPFGPTTVGLYGLAARRHMYEYGTTSEQLAEIRVAAALHAHHNKYAFLQDLVTIDDVVNSPMISDPLHRLDCCVITDGGGAIVVVSPDVAKSLERQTVKVLGLGEAVKHTNNGRIDLTYTAAVGSGPRAFAEAGVTPADINYASIYDSFTITVLETLEDLGFCEKGQGGRFVSGGALQAPDGRLPFNTDGGGQCNNHPANRGGITKVIEAVRQLRGEANAPVQVKNCELAIAHSTGGSLGHRHGSATVVLGREDV